MSKKTIRLRDEYDGKVGQEIFIDGNFTVALLTHEKGHFIGVAKRNPACDEFIPDRGLDIAFSRALVNLDKKVHPARYKKKVK